MYLYLYFYISQQYACPKGCKSKKINDAYYSHEYYVIL